MATKPVKWTFNSGSVDPAWSWFWAGQTWCLPMWEGTGTSSLADIGSLKKPATLVGATWASDATDGVKLRFNSGQYVDMTSPIGFGTLVNQSSYTAYAIVRSGIVDGNYHFIFMDWSSGGFAGTCGLGQSSTKKWGIYDYPHGLHWIYSNASVVSGSLVTLVATWDGTTQKLYVNGTQEGGDFSVNTLAAGSNLTIGRGGAYADYYWNGDMLMVGAQCTAWSAQHVADFAANPFGPITQVRSTIRFSSATSGTPMALRATSGDSQGGTLSPSRIKIG